MLRTTPKLGNDSKLVRYCPSRGTSPQPIRLARSSSTAPTPAAFAEYPTVTLPTRRSLRRHVRERASGIGPRLTQQLVHAEVSAAASHADCTLTPDHHHRRRHASCIAFQPPRTRCLPWARVCSGARTRSSRVGHVRRTGGNGRSWRPLNGPPPRRRCRLALPRRTSTRRAKK